MSECAESMISINEAMKKSNRTLKCWDNLKTLSKIPENYFFLGLRENKHFVLIYFNLIFYIFLQPMQGNFNESMFMQQQQQQSPISSQYQGHSPAPNVNFLH